MATTYTDNGYVYGAQMSDGVSAGGMGLSVTSGVGFVPEDVLDAAAGAYFAVINAWLPIVSATKISTAGGNSDWTWSAPGGA